MDLVDGAIPAEQLEALVEEIERNPPHPGSLIRDFCLQGPDPVPEAARLLDMDPAQLAGILDGRRRISPDLAVRMEALGWSSADLWVKLQAHYDLAQARLRAERRNNRTAERLRAAAQSAPR